MNPKRICVNWKNESIEILDGKDLKEMELRGSCFISVDAIVEFVGERMQKNLKDAFMYNELWLIEEFVKRLENKVD